MALLEGRQEILLDLGWEGDRGHLWHRELTLQRGPVRSSLDQGHMLALDKMLKT